MVGTWMRLAHVALSSSGDSLDTGAFTAKDYLWVQIKRYRTGSVNSRIRVNGDSGSNYAHRYSGGANSYSESTSTNQTSIYSHAATSNESFTNYFITNKADKEKLMIIEEVNGGASGSGNAPERAEVVAKWTNTSDQITSIQCVNTDSGDLTSGTYITVFGASDDVVTDEKTTLEDATATVSPVSITSATGWDTTNAGSNLSIDSSGKITQGNMTANGRLTYDLGSNLQGTWTIDYDFQRTSSSGGNVRPMAVATNTGSINDSGVDNNAVGQYGDTNFNAFKKEGTNADSAQGWIAGTTDMRYIRLSRTSATNFRMEVFTDSDRTTYDTSSCGGGCSGNSGIINQTISLTGGLRYLVSGNGDAGSSHTGTIENIKVYDGAIAGTTVPSPPPTNTRYEEVDTRKIYRRTEAGEYLKVGTKWTPATTITYTGNTNTDNHGISYDIGSSASDTWVLRFEHTVTSTIGTTNGDVNVFCGLSDKDMNTTHQQNQDWIGVRLMLSAKSGSDYGLIRPNTSNDGSPQGGSASNNYGYMGSGTENTKFYIEIIRTSSSAYTISISNGNDYNGDVLSARGGSTSATALRYIKFGDQANTSTQPWDGKIENVQFWDNTVSAGGGTEVAIAKAEWKERGSA